MIKTINITTDAGKQKARNLKAAGWTVIAVYRYYVKLQKGGAW